MHWKAPATMFSAFAVGIAFALGHHLFYQSLDGKPVDSAVFDQQVNIGAGTAFAFLVKTFLVVAVGTAFIQVLWKCLLNKPASVSRVDSITQLSSSLIEFLNFRSLKHYPVLSFLALVSWTLPLAAIVPPATLSVRMASEPVLSRHFDHVPTLDFSQMPCAKTYVSSLGPEDPNPSTAYGGSTDSMNQLAFGVAFAGTIPTIPSPAPNSSYTSRFYGPALQCSNTPSSIMYEFNSVFGYNITFPLPSCSTVCPNSYSYLAWVPDSTSRVPFGNYSLNQYQYINFDSTIGSYDWPVEPASLYIGVYLGQSEPGWAVVNCSLYNASYEVALDYREGNQTVGVKKDYVQGVHFSGTVSQSSCSGSQDYYCPTGVTTYTTAEELSYQGIMDSFGKIIVGSINKNGITYQDGYHTEATMIMSTGLGAIVSSSSDPSVAELLARSAEQMFENITIGLLSSTVFAIPAESNLSSTADVAYLSFPNIYVYSWNRLVLSYGLAVLFTGICVLIGAFTMFSSGHSYSFTFSTIARTTRDHAWDMLIRHKDTAGSDPLPKYIAKASIPVGGLTDPRVSDQYDSEHNVIHLSVDLSKELKPVESAHTEIGTDFEGEERQNLMWPGRVVEARPRRAPAM